MPIRPRNKELSVGTKVRILESGKPSRKIYTIQAFEDGEPTSPGWYAVSDDLAVHISDLIAVDRHNLVTTSVASDLDTIYRSREKQTTKQTLIEARLGQGQFRSNVAKRWNNECAMTSCAIVELLRASHIKPWSKSSNDERLNPANGILLAAHLDALFDCGLISFENDGTMLVSAQIADDLKQFNLPDRLRREPTKDEKRFLAYHRRYVFAA